MVLSQWVVSLFQFSSNNQKEVIHPKTHFSQCDKYELNPKKKRGENEEAVSVEARNRHDVNLSLVGVTVDNVLMI